MEQERAQWSQYRENMEREIAELRRRLSEGQEEENLENEMKKVHWNGVPQFLFGDRPVWVHSCACCNSSAIHTAWFCQLPAFVHGSHHDLIHLKP